MIISRTPFRISFFGGGTDYPQWFTEHGGKVIATTIDKYAYLSIRNLPPFFNYKYFIAYSKIETANSIEAIEHPAVRAILKCHSSKNSLAVHYEGDLPARSGLGTNSSFTVGLIHSLHALNGQLISKTKLAEKAIRIEQEELKEAVGSQDQINAAFGGFNQIEFDSSGFRVSPVIIPTENLQHWKDHLLLYFTGFSRTASHIAQSKINNFPQRKPELLSLRQMVDEAISILQSRSTDFPIELGHLLNESWEIKKRLSPIVSTPTIDEIYSVALKAGAIGGKILGAGGGGFLLLVAPPERQSIVQQALQDLVHVPFKFDHSGSQIIFYQPETES